MPSTPKMLFDLTVSAGVLLGGAWLAAEVSTPAGAAETTPPPVAPGVTLTIDGVRSDTGEIIVMVFDEEAAYTAYDHTKTAELREVSAATGTMKVSFEKLTTGPYAIVLFHDENGDDDLNMKYGIPLEGYGTSGAKGIYDDPGFQQALVTPGNVTVQMYYLQ